MTGREIDRFRRIEAIFDATLEYPPGAERDCFLRRECDSDEAMLEEIRRLIEDHERISAAVPQSPDRSPDTLPQFGSWRAIRLLGRGGMGTVYLAERSDGAFRMSAAVKVVPLALVSLASPSWDGNSTGLDQEARLQKDITVCLPKEPDLAEGIYGGCSVVAGNVQKKVAPSSG